MSMAGPCSGDRSCDPIIRIERMTFEAYKKGGKNLSINYSFSETPFGNIIIASTQKGVCYIAFEDNHQDALNSLKREFPNATFRNEVDLMQRNALSIFQRDGSKLPEIKLYLKGSDFQMKVWVMLLKIPFGRLSTYGNIASKIGNINASRAVGGAIGRNPVAFIIPCHRVVKSSGEIGGYRWGVARKATILAWEEAMAQIAEQGPQ